MKSILSREGGKSFGEVGALERRFFSSRGVGAESWGIFSFQKGFFRGGLSLGRDVTRP